MISKAALSTHRQTIHRLVEKVRYLSSKCLYADPLIHGSPLEVYRRCGGKGCKCSKDPDYRHGPYPVIQVVRNGRSRQVCLRKSQRDLYEQAKHYQYQMNKLAELKQTCQTLQETVRTVIEQRTLEFPKDD